jgi:predicted glutamine amidotransferase
MCVAVMKPEGKILSEETLRECWDANPHGAGFMYSDGSQLRIEKGFMQYDAFREAWEDKQDLKAVLHFRIRTHGDTDAANTHPFQVGKTLGFVHNGTINTAIKDKKLSDTYHFNKNILQHIYRTDSKFIFKEHYKELITNYIGWSKLVFLTAKGEHAIVNEEKGVWDDGVWYSNRSYLPAPVYVPKAAAQKPQKPVLLTSNPNHMVLGERIEVIGHPNVKGKGFIAYFGQGLTIGVQLDGKTHCVGVNSTYVYPEQGRVIDVFGEESSGDLVVGDYVYRIGYEGTLGEVLELKGKQAKVEFTNTINQTFYTIWVSVDKLDYWENMPCGV